MLRFDFTNMMQEAVGSEYGIADSELEALAPRGAAIHAELQARRSAGELPFYDLPGRADMLGEIEVLAAELREQFDTFVVLGIGGSALGTTAVATALRFAGNLDSAAARLFVLDNVDPDSISSYFELLDAAKTCFFVISKSGTTVETTSQFLFARRWADERLGDACRDHFVLITDPEQGALRELSQREGYRSCAIPPGVGGRFTVFTSVSLLPLACVGVDIAALLHGAARFAPNVCNGELMANPAYLNAALQYLAYRKGLTISVLMPYSDRLRDLADWYRQLWAESLGKKFALDGTTVHVGPTPVKALGTTDQHSQVQLYVEGPFDKTVTFITVDTFDRQLALQALPEMPSSSYLDGHSFAELIDVEQRATAAALVRGGRPNCTISLPQVSAESVGALLYMFEVQTLFAGALFGVDPLDQPGVEEGKLFTYALMGRDGFEEKATEYERISASVQQRVLKCS